MNYSVIILISAAYLGLLSLVAYFADRKARQGKSLLNNPYVYALSLAVYCTAWTYYGSVGKATSDGLSFLSIYVGPLLSMPLWWFVVRKILLVSNALHLTTLADFIATRFGKSLTLSVLVTLLSVIGVVPYISIQLKAINSSLNVISTHPEDFFFTDSALLVTLMLAVFILIFTFRTVDSTKKHAGLVTAIAVESIVKLVGFLLVGVFITYFLYDGFDDIFAKTSTVQLGQFHSITGLDWPVMLLLSMSAVVFLPRQFHVIVSENANPDHLKTAMWVFPAYLLAINLFVVPIALGGHNLLSGSIDPDMYVLALPLFAGQTALALVTYIGGFSAATGMIIISTIALSMMVSNNLVIPLIIKSYDPSKINERKALLTRRVAVLITLGIAFLYFRFIADRFSLVYIGLISFAAVAQFAPTVLASLYWKDVTRQGAVWALVAGFAVWFYTLVIPSGIEVGLLPQHWLTHGLAGVGWLKPEAFLGLQIRDPIVHGTFWSLFFNITFLITGTLLSHQTAKERNMANFYTEAYQYTSDYDQLVWKGSMIYKDLQGVLENILGREKTRREMEFFKQQFGRPIEQNGEVSPQLVSYAEKLLTGAIGASSARMLIASISKEEEIELSEVLAIIKENHEINRLNHQLSAKSLELERKTYDLEMANKRLRNLDVEKDDFISTVTHEMRTPLTSIRAISEILFDNPDLSEAERENFLATVVGETERMTRLINQVLDLEKLESGKVFLHLHPIDLTELIHTSLDNFRGLARERNLLIEEQLPAERIVITGDEDRLTQVMVNLISNAVKHAFEHTVVRVGAQMKANRVQVWVKDEGKGIDPESLLRIFDKFYQARNQTTRKPKGTGLGLSISKRIVNMHGGEIWAESTVGSGTVFCFYLPVSTDVISEERNNEQKSTDSGR